MREMEKREGVSDVFMRRARAKGDEFRERVRTPYVFRICGKEESLGEIRGDKGGEEGKWNPENFG